LGPGLRCPMQPCSDPWYRLVVANPCSPKAVTALEMPATGQASENAVPGTTE
jgi:hypothetical protein